MSAFDDAMEALSKAQIERNAYRDALWEMVAAHRRIAAIDPAIDSAEGDSEWGASEGFDKAQEIAHMAIKRYVSIAEALK